MVLSSTRSGLVPVAGALMAVRSATVVSGVAVHGVVQGGVPRGVRVRVQGGAGGGYP